MLSIVKFWEGGWITLLVTGFLMAIAFAVRGHYRGVMHKLARLQELAEQFNRNAQSQPMPKEHQCNTKAKTAVVFVSGFNGLGVHTLLTVNRIFGGVFSNFVFIQAGIVDAGNFKGSGEIEKLKEHIKSEAEHYAECMRRLGYYAESATDIGTDVVETAGSLAKQVALKFPNSVFFGGQLVFENESVITRFLHNHTVFTMQRKFFQQGLHFLVLPIRV
jgi:hypothetical protein